MNHEWFQARLLDLQDEELPASQRQELLRHLQDCPACRQQVEHWNQTRQALSELGKWFFKEEPFVGRVMERIGTIPAYQPAGGFGGLIRIPEWLYPELGLAAAAMVLFAIHMFLQQPAVSSETLLLSRMPQDVQWMGRSGPSGYDGILPEEV
ncbi:MAG: zf-HC2 domain-containing protein [Candidatus Omnitrophica bacterium]|nr:zf-HC2 domain-containing protein [Candidatus Omnitrophota bacterium]